MQLQHLWPSKSISSVPGEEFPRLTCRAQYGTTWVYPRKEYVALQGEDNLTYYKMDRGLFNKGFCRSCGVPVENKAAHISDAERDALPEGAKFWYERGQIYRSLNAKVLDGVDLAKLKTERIDGWKNILPLYENP